MSRISCIVSCPGAVSLFFSREAMVKCAPKSGDRSLEGLPSSPMAKETTLALLHPADTKFSNVRLSSIAVAVVTILHTSAPLAISRSKILFILGRLIVLSKSWKDAISLAPVSPSSLMMFCRCGLDNSTSTYSKPFSAALTSVCCRSSSFPKKCP